MDKIDKDIVESLWSKKVYYEMIEKDRQGSGFGNNDFISNFAKYLDRKNFSILDVGCGEGSVVKYLSEKLNSSIKFFGIDVTPIAIQLAKSKNINNAQFELYNGHVLPFKNNSFEAVISSFVFEHLVNPEVIFYEMSRVLKPGGFIMIVCPNYGSPFFFSPCHKENKIKSMVKRLGLGFLPMSSFKKEFRWNKVDPIVTSKDQHKVDYDTLVEPNLFSFKKFIKVHSNFSIIELDSGWSKFGYGGSSIIKMFFLYFIKFLGILKFPMVKYYGPFFFVIIKKND